MQEEKLTGEICDICGKEYKVAMMLPDSLWELIKPDHANPGAGLLCANCIINRIEDRFDLCILHVHEIDLN